MSFTSKWQLGSCTAAIFQKQIRLSPGGFVKEHALINNVGSTLFETNTSRINGFYTIYIYNYYYIYYYVTIIYLYLLLLFVN